MEFDTPTERVFVRLDDVVAAASSAQFPTGDTVLLLRGGGELRVGLPVDQVVAVLRRAQDHARMSRVVAHG